MKKKQEQHPQTNEQEDEHELEIIKAVAQAWHSHSTTSSSPSAANEFDTRRLNFKNSPSRFKLEAINKISSSNNNVGASWDFGQSLWDSYEIVTLSKRLEAGMVLDHEFPDESAGGSYGKSRSISRKLESKNSLRNILNRVSSRRFDDS